MDNNALLAQMEPLSDSDIIVLGLGPGSLHDLTFGAWQALQNAHTVWFRTQRHPAVSTLTELLQTQNISVQTFDPLYEKHDLFDEVYQAIVQELIQSTKSRSTESTSTKSSPIVYAVPGHPWVGEATTALLLEEARQSNLKVHVLGGISFVDATYAELGIDIMNGAQVADAMLIAQQHHPQVETSSPLLIGQVYSRTVASDLKLTLFNAYPAEHQVTLLSATATSQAQRATLPLYELDHENQFDHLTSLYVPPLMEHSSLTALQEIVAHLRAPEGCPWDQEQTFATLRADLLDECVEVLEAIDLDESYAAENQGDNSQHMAEELGDLLMVTMMLIQIATEEERFQMGDVVRGIVTKLIRRHPHVFDNVEVENVDEIVTNWDAIKAQEKADRGEVIRSPLDGIPVHLPALQKAKKLQSKAHKAGLLDREALAKSNPTLTALLGPEATEEHLGELLWQLVAVTRSYDLNAEDALRNYMVRYRQKHQKVTIGEQLHQK